MVKRQLTGKRRKYKDYILDVSGYSRRKGYARLRHIRTGNTKDVKL